MFNAPPHGSYRDEGRAVSAGMRHGWATILCTVLLAMTGLPGAQAAPWGDPQAPLTPGAAPTPPALSARPLPATPQAVRAELLYGPRAGRLSGHRTRVRERIDPWLAYDKVQHVTFSALLSVSGQYGLENKLDWARGDALPVAIGATAAIGLGKELYDWRLGPRRFFSYRDMVANGLGMLVATGFILL